MGRPVAVALTLVLLAWAVAQVVAVYNGAVVRGEVGYDANLYLTSAQRWLSTGEFYYPVQFVGTYPAAGAVMLYPPSALYLFAPLSFLPRVLWWAIPLGIFGWHLYRTRPAWWTWPILAGIAALLPTAAILVYGNTDLWSAASVALACRWPVAALGLAVKPSLFPLAFLFARSRQWWIGAVVCGVLALPLGGLWLDWLTSRR